MQSSKLYSTKTFTLDCGKAIALPNGLSVHRIKATKSSIAVHAQCRKKSFRVTAQPETLVSALLKACKFMLHELSNGWIPGHTLQIAEDKLCLSYSESIDAYSIVIGYPCISRLAYRRKSFYIGTSNTKDRHIATVRSVANKYREERIRDYCDWFKKQLSNTIATLTAIEPKRESRMNITKLRIRLIKRQKSLSESIQEHFLVLPVHIGLLASTHDPDLFEIHHPFKITVDSKEFEQYGLIQISHYGTISRLPRHLLGVTGTDTRIEIWWQAKGYLKRNGTGKIVFYVAKFEVDSPKNEITPFEIEEIRGNLSIVDFEASID